MSNAKLSKINILSVEHLREYLYYESLTGVFTWVNKNQNANCIKVGDIAGDLHKASGYTRICIDGKRHYAHRLAWLYMTGVMPKNLIDHINGDRSDNRFCNLREATIQQNNQNQKISQKGNKSGFLGVSFKKATGKYKARVQANGKNKFLGYFVTPEEASKAYIEAKRIYHPFGTI